ncbi:MAG: alpha/beta fold hydrolase [Opitutaceae bacterium]
MLALACALPATETVVLLHGLGRTPVSMQRMATTLEREGYRVVNLRYSSRTAALETLAHEWLPARMREIDATRVHFVTHSMGGIVLRLWLRDHGVPPNLGRVVMLAPPNAGSEVADRLAGFAPFWWFTGRNGRRLGTSADALPHSLGAWPASAPELGVIAGDRSLNPLFSSWLPGADDGKVTVAATHLAGESDHVTLHHSHTWLAWRSPTIQHVNAFLRTGRFPGR